MLATLPVPRVAICQMPMKATNSAIDRIAARKRSEEVIAQDLSAFAGTTAANIFAPSRSRRLPDLEAVEVVLGGGRIEGLAHHSERFVGSRRRRQPHLGHGLARIGGEIDLLRHRLVVDIALDLAPALHL